MRGKRQSLSRSNKHGKEYKTKAGLVHPNDKVYEVFAPEHPFGFDDAPSDLFDLGSLVDDFQPPEDLPI